MSNELNKERPLILVGPDGNVLQMRQGYQDPKQWETLETEDAVLLVARPAARTRGNSLMEQISDYVDSHLAQRITLKSVAAHCGVSVSTVTQLFQKKAGVTFHKFLTQRRMEAAQKLIHAGMPLEEAGRLAGYTDHSTFYRAFKQTFGISPREYRKTIDKKN